MVVQRVLPLHMGASDHVVYQWHVRYKRRHQVLLLLYALGVFDSSYNPTWPFVPSFVDLRSRLVGAV
jgi:hypothetical protein